MYIYLLDCVNVHTNVRTCEWMILFVLYIDEFVRFARLLLFTIFNVIVILIQLFSGIFSCAN